MEGGEAVADHDHTSTEEDSVEEENLKDTFLSSIAIGVIILLIWFWIFGVYLNRL